MAVGSIPIPATACARRWLKIISNFRSIRGIGVTKGWQEVLRDDYGNWLKQRDDSVAGSFSIGDKKDKTVTVLFETYGRGLKTKRDAWCFNASRAGLEKSIRETVDYYNRKLDN